MPRNVPPNRKVLQAMNRKNGVAEPERRAVVTRFRAAGGPSLDRIFHQYAASMDATFIPLGAPPDRPGLESNMDRFRRIPTSAWTCSALADWPPQ